MRGVEQLIHRRIIRNQQERQQQLDAALASIDTLPTDLQDVLLAKLIARVTANAPISPRTKKASFPRPSSRATLRLHDGSGKKTDRAEALVFAHPEDGVTAEQIGKYIDQPPNTAASTLRQVMNTRKTIERRDGRWYPADKHVATGNKITNRAAVTAVLAGGKALGTAEIFRAVQKLIPDAIKGSIASEISRMKREQLVSHKGRSGRGPLYTLASEGANAAAS